MKDYAYIRAWGRMLRSFPQYIEGEVGRRHRSLLNLHLGNT